MKTKHVKDQKISALIDVELSPAESKAIYRHIDQCRKCRDKFVQWQHIEHYIRYDETEIVPPPFLEQKVVSHVHRATSAAGNGWLRIFKPAFYFTAAGLVAVGIFLGTLMGARLAPLLAGKNEEIDLIAVLSSQDTYSPSITEIDLDFLNGGES